MRRLVLLLLACSAVAEEKMWHRLESPSTYLKVPSCINIDESTYGDPPGSCEEHGYTVTCESCFNLQKWYVSEAGTCDQKHTKCRFKSLDEKCVGSSLCPYSSAASKAEVLEAA